MVLDNQVQTTDLISKCKVSFDKLLSTSDYVVVEVCQKRPTIVSKETYYSVKRDLL